MLYLPIYVAYLIVDSMLRSLCGAVVDGRNADGLAYSHPGIFRPRCCLYSDSGL